MRCNFFQALLEYLTYERKMQMADKFKYNLNFFFTEQQIESLRELRKSNSEYNNLRASHAKNSQKMDFILNNLPAQEKQFAEKYQDEFYKINSIEFNWLYLQGYKDCIKLLSCLGL